MVDDSVLHRLGTVDDGAHICGKLVGAHHQLADLLRIGGGMVANEGDDPLLHLVEIVKGLRDPHHKPVDADGLIGIFYKVFGKSDAVGEVNGMMLTASAVSAIFFFLVGWILNRARGEEAPKIRRSALLFILMSGVTGCVYIRLNVSLSGLIPSAIFFPVANGGIVVLTTVAGALFFKEKLNKIQLIGILLGLLGIVVTGCGEAIWNLL